jgi:hypothetical protein
LKDVEPVATDIANERLDAFVVVVQLVEEPSAGKIAQPPRSDEPASTETLDRVEQGALGSNE